METVFEIEFTVAVHFKLEHFLFFLRTFKILDEVRMRCECQLFTESSVCLENVLGVDGLELLVHFINCS